MSAKVGTAFYFFGRRIVVWHNPLTELLLKVYDKIGAPWEYLEYLRNRKDMIKRFPEDVYD